MSFYRFYFYFLLSTTICSFASESGSPTTVQEAQTPPIDPSSSKSLLTRDIEKALKNGTLKPESSNQPSRSRALTAEQSDEIFKGKAHEEAMAAISQSTTSNNRQDSEKLYGVMQMFTKEYLKQKAEYLKQQKNPTNNSKSAPAKVKQIKSVSENEMDVIKNQLKKQAARKPNNHSNLSIN